MYNTTEAHFEVFQKEVYYWVDYFGLYSWSVFVIHDQTISNASPAVVQCDVKNRTAIVQLNENWNFPIDNDILKRIAFHEVCEILLAKLKYLANERTSQSDHIDEEVHVIIRRLENTLFLRH